MADTEITEIKFQALRESMEVNFLYIRERLERLQDALEKLAATAVTEEAYQRQARSILRAHTRLNSQDEKLLQHRLVYRILNIIGALFGAVIIAVAVAFATGKATIAWQ